MTNDEFISILRSKLHSKYEDDSALNSPMYECIQTTIENFQFTIFRKDGSIAQMLVYYIFVDSTSFSTRCHDQLELTYDYAHVIFLAIFLLGLSLICQYFLQKLVKNEGWVKGAYLPIFFATKTYFLSSIIT